MPYPEDLELAGAHLQRWDAQRDQSVLHTLNEDESFRRFVPIPRDEAALAAMSERFAGHWDECGFGLWAARAAGSAGAGWVGACHPRWHPGFAGEVEIAWSLSSSLRGRGLATAAGRTAAEACFSELGLDQVIAFVDPANAPSLAVAERIGFTPTGDTTDPDGKPLRLFALRPA